MHVLHRDVRIVDILDRAAAAATGFDAQAVVGVFEAAVFYDYVMHTTDGCAANGHAVAVQKIAVGDGDVFATEFPALDFCAGFDGNVVVAGVNGATGDGHVAAIDGIHAVGVGRTRRRPDSHPFNDHLFTVIEHKMRSWRVDQLHSGQVNVLAVVEHDE